MRPQCRMPSENISRTIFENSALTLILIERVELSKVWKWFCRRYGHILQEPDAALKLYPKLETEFIAKGVTPVNKLKITTKFFDGETDERIDPTTLINQRCKVKAAINEGYICIAAKPSIQLYVSEAIVLEKHCDRNQRLLK